MSAPASKIPTAGHVKIILHAARSLYNAQCCGKMDPFVRVVLGPNQEESEVCKSGHIAPTWPNNPTFYMEVGRDKAASYEKIKITLINENMCINDDIGVVEIPLEKIVPDWNRPEEPLWIWVGRPDNQNTKAGELHATIKYVPPLTVTVLEGQGLIDVQLIGKQDPYVVLEMVGCLAKGDNGHRKTRTHDDGDRNPKWGDSFEFNIMDEKALKVAMEHGDKARLASAKEEKKSEPGLWCQVMDENIVVDAYIGWVFIPLLQLMETKRSGQPVWFPLNKGKAALGIKEPAGKICLSMK